MSLAFACAYLQGGCSFWDQVTTRELGSSMMRKLEIVVSRNMNLSGIVTMILGAMYVGAMAMAVFLILVQLQSRKRTPRTFASLLRVKLGVLGLFWDFWAKSVSELQHLHVHRRGNRHAHFCKAGKGWCEAAAISLPASFCRGRSGPQIEPAANSGAART